MHFLFTVLVGVAAILAYAKGSSVAFGFAPNDVIDPAATKNNHVTESANRRLRSSNTQDDESRIDFTSIFEHFAACLKEVISSFHAAQPRASLFEALETESEAWDHHVIKGTMEEANALTPAELQAYYEQLEEVGKDLNLPNGMSLLHKDALLSSYLVKYDEGLLAHVAANRARYGFNVKDADDILNLLYAHWSKGKKSPDDVLQLLQKRGDHSFPVDYEQLTVLDGYIKHVSKAKRTDDTLVKTMLRNFGDAKSSRIYMRNTNAMLGSKLPEESLVELMSDWKVRKLDVITVTRILRPDETSAQLDDLDQAILKAYNGLLDGKTNGEAMKFYEESQKYHIRMWRYRMGRRKRKD